MKYVLQNKEYPIGEQISYYHEVLIVKENHIVETDSKLSKELLIKDGFTLIEEDGEVFSAKDLQEKEEEKEEGKEEEKEEEKEKVSKKTKKKKKKKRK